MIQRVKQYCRQQAFKPSLLGLFINPFFFARAGLYRHIKDIAHYGKGDLLDIVDSEWDKAHGMILRPVIQIAKLVTPIMQKQGGGSIVNITTFSAFEPSLTFPTSSVYRAAVSSFTKLYSDRYGADNIRMNCLLPGFTDSLDLPDEFAQMSALKRLARADEQAKAAAFLLSDESSYITGQSIRVDGGVTRHF